MSVLTSFQGWDIEHKPWNWEMAMALLRKKLNLHLDYQVTKDGIHSPPKFSLSLSTEVSNVFMKKQQWSQRFSTLKYWCWMWRDGTVVKNIFCPVMRTGESISGSLQNPVTWTPRNSVPSPGLQRQGPQHKHTYTHVHIHSYTHTNRYTCACTHTNK